MTWNLCQYFRRQWDGTASQADALAAVSGGAEQNLSQQMQAVLRETVLTINELLRHFLTSACTLSCTTPRIEAYTMHSPDSRTPALQGAGHLLKLRAYYM